MPVWLKARLKRLCGERLLGIWDCYRLPRHAFGGPFNQQEFRQRMFGEIVAAIPFSTLVETGTFRGTTTAYLHTTTGLPVETAELQPRLYSGARHRLRRYRQIHVHLGDSRRFLQELAQRADLHGTAVFFYLDAHWYADLPLREELQIIFANWPRAVVMIDDFQVPGDADYHYDSYGEDQVLCLEYLGRPDLATFFPAERGARESGLRRGCVVLAQDPELVTRLRQCPTLREHVSVGCPEC